GTQKTQVITINDDDATPGMLAFKANVWAITHAQCVSCHNSGTPQHANDNYIVAYSAAKPFANFNSPKDSILVSPTTNNQQRCGSACMTDGKAMTAAITAWAQAEGTGNTTTT